MRTQNEEKNKKSNCVSSNALISLLTTYERQDVHASFSDMDQMCKDWLLTSQADDTETRQNYLYSLQIIQELGAVVKAIPKKKVKNLVAELTELTNAVKDQ